MSWRSRFVSGWAGAKKEGASGTSQLESELGGSGRNNQRCTTTTTKRTIISSKSECTCNWPVAISAVGYQLDWTGRALRTKGEGRRAKGRWRQAELGENKAAAGQAAAQCRTLWGPAIARMGCKLLLATLNLIAITLPPGRVESASRAGLKFSLNKRLISIHSVEHTWLIILDRVNEGGGGRT